MPKIGKDLVTIRGKQIEIEVHYTRKTKFHYKGLPAEIYEMTSLGKHIYDSETALKYALRTALEAYHEKIKQTRKMILFTLDCSRELFFDQGGSSIARTVHKNKVSPKFRPELPTRFAFGFDFHVLLEISAEKVEYYQLNEDNTPGFRMPYANSSRANLIEWTPERERFFRDLAAQLQQLVYSASSFFDAPDMLQQMDTHGFKLLNR